jgi:flagellar biosynthetic protein FliO
MDILQQIAAVAVVLGLLGAALWWLRRRGFAAVFPAGRSAGRRLESLERLSLGPQHTLHLVRLHDRALLVASSPAGCALIHDLPAAELAPPRERTR